MQNQYAPLPLPRGKHNAATAGCILLMLAIASSGLSLAVIQGPVLTGMGAMEHFSLLTILSTLGVAIMTPIGGKLGDLFGRRRLVVLSGLVCAAATVGMGLVQSALPFLALRLLVSVAQGAFTAAPYILIREINQPSKVPKGMGYLSSAVAIGGFGGGLLAGALADLGMLRTAILFPVVPLLLGVALVGFQLPGQRHRAGQPRPRLDLLGICFLAIALGALLFSTSYGSRLGWGHVGILTGFAAAVIAVLAFLGVESRAEDPILPLRLFRNPRYTALLAVSMLSFFYLNTMNVYTPLAVQQVMGRSATLSGSLQLPRTVITIFFPAMAGVWVGRRRGNAWKAMALATGIVALSFLCLGFTSSATPVWLYVVAIGVTGLAEGFRSVSIMPVAQSTLPQEDLGVGTALLAFANSLSSLLSAAVCGVILDANGADLAMGINLSFLFTSLLSALGLVLVLAVVRRQMDRCDRPDQT